MSVIQSISRRTTTAQTQGRTFEREESEFDGLWINVGVNMKDEESGETSFVRLPRGVAVSDLKPQKMYASMDPDRAAQANLMNQLIDMIQTRASELGEGEAVSINLEAQLYRRQEETVAPVSTAGNDALKAALFG